MNKIKLKGFPRWLIEAGFKLSSLNNSFTLDDAQKVLGYDKHSISVLLRELKLKGWIKPYLDKNDNRKRRYVMNTTKFNKDVMDNIIKLIKKYNEEIEILTKKKEYFENSLKKIKEVKK